jgi:HK97 family phage major capsid protein
VLGKIKAFEAKAKEENRESLTADESTSVSELLKEAESISDRIKTAERIREQEIEQSRESRTAPAPHDGAPAEVKQNRAFGSRFAGVVRALAASKGVISEAIRYAEAAGDAEVAKALGTSSSSAGGYLVPSPIASEVIPALQAATIVRRMGAVPVPLPNGIVNIPKIATAGAATWIGENANVGKTEPVFGNVQLSKKKLAALIPISNDLIRYSAPSVDSLIVNDTVRAIAAAEDSAYIRGAAAGNNPVGVKNLMHASMAVAMTATPDVAKVTSDLNKAVARVVAANVNLVKPGWMMSPRTFFYLKALRDSTGAKAFPELGDGMLLGYPVGMTTQIPDNLGGGTNESEVYFANFSDLLIGEALELSVAVSDQAAYHDGSNVVAAFSLDQTVIRVILETDFAMRYDKSASMITGVTWS